MIRSWTREDYRREYIKLEKERDEANRLAASFEKQIVLNNKERDELKFECRRWERIINRASESSEARIILAEAVVFVAFNKEKALEG